MGRVVPHPRLPLPSPPLDPPLFAPRSSSVHHRDPSQNLNSLMEPELRRSRSAHSLPPPLHVGATGSILSLLDRDLPACPPFVDSAPADVPSSWFDRPWMRSSRRKSTSNGLDKSQKTNGAQQRLETVAEAEVVRVPKWKQFLRKLMRDGKSKGDGSKGSRSDGKTAKGNGQHAGVGFLREKQSKGSVILCQPLPPRKSSEKPANLIWERRNAAPIAALDLMQLKAARAKRYTKRAVR